MEEEEKEEEEGGRKGKRRGRRKRKERRRRRRRRRKGLATNKFNIEETKNTDVRDVLSSGTLPTINVPQQSPCMPFTKHEISIDTMSPSCNGRMSGIPAFTKVLRHTTDEINK
jgi:hypothetical protein